MISFDEALAIVRAQVQPVSEKETVPVSVALGRVLAEPIVARMPNPSFDNSAVDGYLIGQPSAKAGEQFKVVGEIRAGSLPPFTAPSFGEAARIFTGAPVPKGRFGIVMQEDVQPGASDIQICEDVSEGDHVRRAGKDFEVGAELLPAGVRIGPAEAALAAWNGLSELAVFRTLRVAALVTGDELREPGEELIEGQIYDSNGPMLEALALSSVPVEVRRERLPDDPSATKEKLSSLAQGNDLLVISGGASVGDYDFVPAAVEGSGTVYFHKVKIKPGKPVLFGKLANSLVFGLPGNPASAFVCFELFVRPALRILSGEAKVEPIWIPARYEGTHEGVGRDEFERVALTLRNGDLWAKPGFEQGSFGIRSLAGAHALARLPSGRSYSGGEPVQVILLSGSL